MQNNILNLLVFGFASLIILCQFTQAWASDSHQNLSDHSEADCKPQELFRIKIPKEKAATPKNPSPNMTRDSMIFYLTAFLDEKKSPIKISAEEIEIPCSALLQEVQKDFRNWTEAKSYSEVFSGIKKLLGTGAYFRAQTLNHPSVLLSPRLGDLETRLKYKTWKKSVIEMSAAKGTKRVLYQSPPGIPEMSIAETYEPNSLDPRETEFIIKRENTSGHYDFYAYDTLGKPALSSSFHNSRGKTTVGPVPQTCVACHYDGSSRQFQKEPSSFSH